MAQAVPSQADKRRSRRYGVQMAVAFEAGARKDRVGICLDVSVEGARFNTASHFEEGDELLLTLIHKSDASLRHCKAKVVRFERTPAQSPLLWRYVTAVKFEEPQRDIEPTLRRSVPLHLA